MSRELVRRRRSPFLALTDGMCVSRTRSMLRRRLTGILMKDAIATQSLPEECFVLQMDGKAKSQHRRFVDALRYASTVADRPHAPTNRMDRKKTLWPPQK